MVSRFGIGRVLALATALAGSSGALAAEGGVWSVSKSSGEVWLTTTGATLASLTQETTLKPGDMVRTGPNGRVLLMRGEESILISPNSVIGLPTGQKDGMSTTILQQAGSILLDVEKRNVKHFEVETPYLAAVVKGTHFQVTVNATNTRVDVQRGQVEVSDFKTGQIAQVMPGQAATSFAHGKSGLSLSGSGTFAPIEQGKPRASTIERVSVPRGGLTAPQRLQVKRVRQSSGTSPIMPARGHNVLLSTVPNHRTVRIAQPIGEVKLNFQTVTHGLAHSTTPIVTGRPGFPDRSSRSGSAIQDPVPIWNGGQNSSPSSAAASSSQPGMPGNGSAALPATVVGPAGPAGVSSPAGNSPGATGAGGTDRQGHGPAGPPGHH